MKVVFILGIIALAAWVLVFLGKTFLFFRMKFYERRFRLKFEGNPAELVYPSRKTDIQRPRSLAESCRELGIPIIISEKEKSSEWYYAKTDALLDSMLKTANKLHDTRENMSCEELGSKAGIRFAAKYENFLNAVDLIGDAREYLRRATEQEEGEEKKTYETPSLEIRPLAEGGAA